MDTIVHKNSFAIIAGGTSLGAFTHLGRGVEVQKNAPGAFGAFGHILNCSLQGCIWAFHPKLVVNYFAPWCKWCIWAFFGTLFSSTQKSIKTRKISPISNSMAKRCVKILKKSQLCQSTTENHGFTYLVQLL